MRRALKICLACLGALFVVLAIGFAWLYFDTQGLPSVESLAQFAPAGTTHATDPCLKNSSIALPFELIGHNLNSALYAAEIPEYRPADPLPDYLEIITLHKPVSVALSAHIARTMLCKPTNSLVRHISEIRVEVQLERRFSGLELFTIFANRLYLGDNIIGVECASQRYFHKEPNQLLIGEAAFIAGLARHPSYYSPYAHPDRALQRRNEVIDAMAHKYLISGTEAAAAKATPLVVETD
jgi:membrane carboxypeptidase/penicillin-binding protein